MVNAVSLLARPENEQVLSYAPKTPERQQIRLALKEACAVQHELYPILDGKPVRTGKTLEVRPPHKRGHLLGLCHQGGEKEVRQAVDAATKARPEWASWSYEDRAGVLLRAAEMLAGRYRARVNAATMLGQSKTVHQAEIDSACELIDFLRFNVHFGRRLLEEQPASAPGAFNRLDYRPLDGFVLAITPFNFTAIAGNLPTAPALMGNTVVWKPATTAVFSAQVVMEVLLEAGLPPGVINLLPAPGRLIGETVLRDPALAGVHFTGSTGTFQTMWRTVAENLEGYGCYPRMVGETGGKDFIFAHPSADPEALAVAAVRGAFEYQGQKCSAASRAYIPKSLWQRFRERLEAEVKAIKMGDVADLGNFMGAVIDPNAYADIKGYIEVARAGQGASVWLGGRCDDSEGYFIEPTVVVAEDPKHRLMCEEIFGPVLTVYCYEDAAFQETLTLCDQTSPYALTGAIFARDRRAIRTAEETLRFAAGNFYINDKPTGAVVGQQPFGGARASGTNDKAGSFLNLVRWISPRCIKENLDPPREVAYPYMLAQE